MDMNYDFSTLTKHFLQTMFMFDDSCIEHLCFMCIKIYKYIT